AGDFNGDGISDIVTGNQGYVSILVGHGDGTFAPQVTFSAGGNASQSLSLGDIDGDDFLDIVTTDTGSSSAWVLMGRGDGTFAPEVSYSVGSAPYSASLGDFNGDGILDVAAASLGTNVVSV